MIAWVNTSSGATPSVPPVLRAQAWTRWRPADPAWLWGAAVSAAAAVLLYTRFSINQRLWRDEAIYVYGAQRLARGVPPYVSIFDPKAPLATMFAGVAAALSRVFGVNDIHAIRLEFFVFSCLTAVAVYLLVHRLWRSVPAAVSAAVVFTSFPIFAQDAIGGPDAKTPAVLAIVVAALLLIERRWFWAAFAAAIATLIWQPLFVFPIAALVLPGVLTPADKRRRAVAVAFAGLAIPVAAVGIYFLAAGAFGKFIEATIVFPLTGNQRVPFSVHERITHMTDVVRMTYGTRETALVALGLLALLVIGGVTLAQGRSTIRDTLKRPFICVVLFTFLGVLGFLIYYDFQGPEDTLALTPYAALGVGGAVAFALRQVRQRQRAWRAAVALLVVAVAALFGGAWVSFDNRWTNNHLLADEYSAGCGLDRILGSDGVLYALGDPTPLAVTHRVNPDRFIYLEENVSGWKIQHTLGGFAGWVAQIQAAHPSVIVLQFWSDKNSDRMRAALDGLGYASMYVGQWHVFVSPDAQASAAANGVRLTAFPTHFAKDVAGKRLPEHNCTA